jgi:predicted permease
MSLHALRLAVRSLIRRPGFSLLAIVTIALGAGANAAVFGVSYGILLKPLAFEQPDRLVAVWPGRFVSQMELRYLREHARGFKGVSATAPGWGFSLTGAGEPLKITAERVSGDLFDTLGADPLLGRRMRPDEDRVGAPKVLMLSYKLWHARFGGDPSVIGRTVRLDDEPHEIIAVMPASFELFGVRSDAWVPLPANRQAFYERTNVSVLVGRLADGVSLEQADREFKALIPRLRADLGFTASYGRDARIEDLRTATTGDVRSSLLVLGAAVVFMLLIAAANLGTLLITRGVSRAREFAVHAALGASRLAIVRLQLIEGLLLSTCGALAGLVVAASGMPAIVRLLPRDMPRTGDIHVDGWVAAAVLGMALAVAVLFGVVPATAAGRPAFSLMLREGGSSESRGARRARGVMVSVQIALALVLAIGAGLMTRTLWRLQHVDSGLDVERILTVRVQPTSARYREPAAVVSYYQQILERLEALPGVQSAGAIQPAVQRRDVGRAVRTGAITGPRRRGAPCRRHQDHRRSLLRSGRPAAAGGKAFQRRGPQRIPVAADCERRVRTPLLRNARGGGRPTHEDGSHRRRMAHHCRRHQRRAHESAGQAGRARTVYARQRLRHPVVDAGRAHKRQSAGDGERGARGHLERRP